MSPTRETTMALSDAGIANLKALNRVNEFLANSGTCSLEDAQLAIQYSIEYIRIWGLMPAAIEAFLKRVASIIAV